MKIRTDFVTNSSSSNYIVILDRPPSDLFDAITEERFFEPWRKIGTVIEGRADLEGFLKLRGERLEIDLYEDNPEKDEISTARGWLLKILRDGKIPVIINDENLTFFCEEH